MGGFSIYGGSADELVLTSGARDYEGSPRLESNLWTSCISYVHRDSSLGGRASGCREESYTSIFPLMWLYRYIHSAPVYVPPLFMCLMIKFPSFSCFRNFLEIESDSELEEKKMEFDIRCISENWQSYVYRNWSYFQFFPNCSINHSPILTGISIFSRIFFWRTKNRLKVRTVIYLYNDNNKNRKSSRRKLGRISWKDDTFISKYSIRVTSTNRIFLEISPTLPRLDFVRTNTRDTRARTWASWYVSWRSIEKIVSPFVFFLFFCENACVAYVGRSKWKASQRGADG